MRAGLLVGVGLALAVGYCTDRRAAAQQPLLLEHQWETDPPLGVNWYPYVEPLRPYRAQLDRIDSTVVQQRVSEAQNVVFESTRNGIANRSEAFEVVASGLRRYAEAGEQPRRILLSAALALADSLEEVERIWESTEQDDLLRPLVEPALVEFGSKIACSRWRTRLASAQRDSAPLLLAIRGLSASRSGPASSSTGGTPGDATDASLERDRELLVTLLRSDRFRLPTKLAAAKSLGSMLDTGLVPLATEIRESGMPQADLLSAWLLHRHESDAAAAALNELVTLQESVATRVAFEAITARHFDLAGSVAPRMLEHPDAAVRKLAVQFLDSQSDEESLRQQGGLLSDPVASVRRIVREQLLAKAADPVQRPLVDEVVDRWLESSSTTGCEQAIVLAVQLRDHLRAEALFRLLSHPEDSITVRAAWGLSILELPSDLLAPILEKCERVTQQYLSGDTRRSPTAQYRVAFLIEALGKHKFEPAEEMLMHYVPKNAPTDALPRVSAVYALGKIFEGTGYESLSQALVARATDANELFPEDPRVRYAATIAVCRIGVNKLRARLEKMSEAKPNEIGYAKDWAVPRMKEASQ